MIKKERDWGRSNYILTEKGKEHAGLLVLQKEMGKINDGNSPQKNRAVLEVLNKLTEIALKAPETDSLKVLSCVTDLKALHKKV